MEVSGEIWLYLQYFNDNIARMSQNAWFLQCFSIDYFSLPDINYCFRYCPI